MRNCVPPSQVIHATPEIGPLADPWSSASNSRLLHLRVIFSHGIMNGNPLFPLLCNSALLKISVLARPISSLPPRSIESVLNIFSRPYDLRPLSFEFRSRSGKNTTAITRFICTGQVIFPFRTPRIISEAYNYTA